ncbi:biopolymer transporter Tol, partial [bacterium]
MILFIFLQFEFGKNKIDYYSFTWMLRETEHFEIYYYKEEEVLLPFVVQVAESAYKKLEEVFSRGLEEKIPLILYASHSHFEETNITPYIMDEWVGGFTESFQNRVVIPFEGDFERLRHVISHEIVHAFQFEILSWIGLTGVIRRAFANVPLWFIEGMAEWAS